MKVFLLGATGGTGYEILKELIRNKHSVKVLVRNPAKLNLASIKQSEPRQVELIEGSVFEMDKLEEGFKGCDAVISALGTGKDNKYTEVYSGAGRKILSAMRKTGIKRLITITAGIIDLSDPSIDNFLMNRIVRPSFNKVYYDMVRWETILDDTNDIDWTCVRPTQLTNKSFTGKYRVKSKYCPEGGRKISRADIADFIVKQINSDEFVHKKPVVCY